MNDGAPLPTVRSDLVIRPSGQGSRCVIKDPVSGRFFELGEQEFFLLESLAKHAWPEPICRDFEHRFGETLSSEELKQFIALAERQHFLEPRGAPHQPVAATDTDDTNRSSSRRAEVQTGPEQVANAPRTARRRKLLYMRWSLWDPDRLFSKLAPRMGFFWTSAFVVTATICILFAAAIVFCNGDRLVSSFEQVWHWQTVVLVWLTLLGVTFLHESAHGLTCKRFGGEVHEIGFLLIFFMPAFYCNVSDAWLFPQKRQRLWVTAAGGFFELFLWSLSVFIWRLTVQYGLVNYLASVVLSLTGVRVFFNFCPFLKLDGYYLLSDWLEIPNLRARSLDYWKAHLRSLLWGASPPAREAHGKLFVVFGTVSFVVSVVFLTLILAVLGQMLYDHIGPASYGAIGVLGLVSGRGLLSGLSRGEVVKMVKKRHVRLFCWILGFAVVVILLFAVPVQDYATGTFELRPANHVEVRAPVAGFLKEIRFDQGDPISQDAVIGKLYISDLESRLARKRADIREAEAQLRELEAGSRPEEIAEQKQRVKRAESWYALSKQELTRKKQQLRSDLKRLDKEIEKYRAEFEFAVENLKRMRGLAEHDAISDHEVLEAKKTYEVSRAELQRVRAERAARIAQGTIQAEVEVVRRRNKLADARSELRLLQAGSRQEKIDSVRAHLERLQHELDYLQLLKKRLVVHSPIAGVVKTARLKESVGKYIQEGELICEIDDSRKLDVEINVTEEQVARLEVGQRVELKYRALPYQTFFSRLTRLAPHASDEDPLQKRVTVFCKFDNTDNLVRPGMTGFARVYCDQRPFGSIILDRLVRVLRTEFWW